MKHAEEEQALRNEMAQTEAKLENAITQLITELNQKAATITSLDDEVVSKDDEIFKLQAKIKESERKLEGQFLTGSTTF